MVGGGGKNLGSLQSDLDSVQNLFTKRSGIGQGSNLNSLQSDLSEALNLFNVSFRSSSELLIYVSTMAEPIENQS